MACVKDVLHVQEQEQAASKRVTKHAVPRYSLGGQGPAHLVPAGSPRPESRKAVLPSAGLQATNSPHRVKGPAGWRDFKSTAATWLPHFPLRI